jgi:hypothetical protein
MEHDVPTTLVGAAKKFWPFFAPAWLFPIVFLYGGTEFEELGHPFLFFFIAIPLFFGSFIRASRPWMEQKVHFWHSAFWGVVIPLLIGTGVVLSRLEEIALLGRTYGV